MNKIKGMFVSRRFRAGGYSIFAVVIVVAIAVLVNMIASSLPSDKTQIDVTSQNLYTLSDQTKQIVNELDKDVTLELIAYTGSEDESISTLLTRYDSLSDHITVTVTDPQSTPSILDTYPELSYANSVVVSCGDKYRVVSYADIYETDYSNYYTTGSVDTSFNGESCLTSAIHYVTSDSLPKLYILTGHGEQELSDTMSELIKDDGFETEDLSLLSLEAVPEDADCLLINAPSSDISEDEATMLTAYLDNGGDIILFTDYINDGEMANLMSVTAHMGVTLQSGLIIEGDSSRCLRGYSYYLLPEISTSSEITSAIADGGYYILVPTAEAIVQTGTGTSTVTSLLTTSDSAFSKSAGLSTKSIEKADGDAEGPFDVSVCAENGDAHLVWTSSAMMLDDSINNAVSGANGDMFMNALNSMVEQTESISIRSKSLSEETLTLTQADATTWTVVFVGVIPVLLVFIGIVIRFRRNRR